MMSADEFKQSGEAEKHKEKKNNRQGARRRALQMWG
jgi:hypothetical protein